MRDRHRQLSLPALTTFLRPANLFSDRPVRPFGPWGVLTSPDASVDIKAVLMLWHPGATRTQQLSAALFCVQDRQTQEWLSMSSILVRYTCMHVLHTLDLHRLPILQALDLEHVLTCRIRQQHQ